MLMRMNRCGETGRRRILGRSKALGGNRAMKAINRSATQAVGHVGGAAADADVDRIRPANEETNREQRRTEGTQDGTLGRRRSSSKTMNWTMNCRSTNQPWRWTIADDDDVDSDDRRRIARAGPHCNAPFRRGMKRSVLSSIRICKRRSQRRPPPRSGSRETVARSGTLTRATPTAIRSWRICSLRANCAFWTLHCAKIVRHRAYKCPI